MNPTAALRRVFLSCAISILAVGPADAEPPIGTAAFGAEVAAFFDREVPSHLAQIPPTGPLPDRVHGALTTGDFSWGTFVRALAAYAETRGSRTVEGRDIVPLVARVGVIESEKGSKAFAQLYAALALRHFGADLAKNALWQSLTEPERAAWRSLLDPTRFYDPTTRRVIDLPENYLGVASRVASLAFQMGVLQDRAFVDALLDRAAEPFTRGALYADDAGEAGRYDRYSNEYARYVYEAAETVGRRDILEALRPSLVAQMALWWDLVAPDGYGYQWGRSLGVVSYLDTLEIVAFVARHPALRPAPLADLASAYRLAWLWLCRDYEPGRHMLSVFAPGRGNYAYISKEREWQQTVGFFGKALMAHDTLMRVLAAEEVASFPAHPRLAPVARFEYFRRGARPAGVWVVRQGALRFALPITSGTRPGIADYLPAPHGLPGFAAPVEQIVPAGASFYELPEGRRLVATDGADEMVPAADGRSLRATWRRFAEIGAKTGALVEPGFEVSIEWRIDGTTLWRTERLTAARDVSVRRVTLVLPSTATSHAPGEAAMAATTAPATMRLTGPEGTLDVEVTGDLPFAAAVRSVADEPLGRGARGAIPTHVTFEATDVVVRPGQPRSWTLRLTVGSPAPAAPRHAGRRAGVAGGCAAGLAGSPLVAPSTATPPPGWEGAAAFYRQQVHDAGIVGSSLLVVRDVDIVAEAHVGVHDAAGTRPVDRDTIYHWASITKTLTAVAIMQLRDRGLLSLDDPVVRYVPEFSQVHNPFGPVDAITIRMLLSHSAGLRASTWPWGGDKAWHPFEPTRWEQLVAMLPYTNVFFEPGSRYSYSNPGILFLGRIIELLTGDDYEVYVAKNILMPLGMHRTFFDRSPYHLLPHRSHSYVRDDDGLREARFDFDTGVTVANGGLNAPMADMTRYLAFLIGAGAGDAAGARADGTNVASAGRAATYDGVLRRASLEEMWVPVLPASDGEGGSGDDVRIGLSFFVERHADVELVGHSGNQNGFLSHLYLHRASRTGYLVAFNTDTSSKATGRPQITRDVDHAIRDRLLRDGIVGR